MFMSSSVHVRFRVFEKPHSSSLCQGNLAEKQTKFSGHDLTYPPKTENFPDMT